MKITVMSIFFPPERGAAPSRIMSMCKAMQARGCDVEVITALANYPKGKLFDEYSGKLFVKEEIEGVKCRRYWLYPSNSNNPFVRVFSMFSFSLSLLFSLPYLIHRKSDIVIVQSPPLLVGLIGSWLGRLVGGKVITNVSDIWPKTALELGVVSKGISYSFFELIERWMYEASHGLMAQSQQTVKYLQGVQDKPTFLYYNLTDRFPFNGKELDKTEFKIVYAGLLGIAQGIHQICEEIDFHELNTTFHIYGDGQERSRIETYVKENDKRGIFLHKSIPKSEISEMLAGFHATIVPLKKPIYGALPSKIFMAIGSQLPIFFSGEGEGRSLVEQKGIGWVSPSNDYRRLEANIKKAVSEAGEYETKKANIARALTDDFNYDSAQDELLKFLKEQTQRKRGDHTSI
ncbi:glycosyltransferase family 4 protein [Neolewinella antarctica]|uniref:Glycosyltransferase involved in cell wall biosynthesis n=1 Tax=Neolewinella antarctica TaxID=442734 RepID=A0ABX0XFB7_9BACT|nr:glycosyltransferase family 4 protein [Neolewinella antarctica]NJC28005.1 glycosyltransferase involved in cell wall biosynthesis [Neolewinella antarctica]